MSLTVNVDMDGVVYDFNEAITSYGELRLGRKLPVTSTWQMWEAWEIGRNEWYEIFHEAIMTGEVFNQHGLDIAGAVKGLKTLIKAGYRVRMVTSKKLRYPESTQAAQIQVIRWLKHHGLLNDVELVFAHDKQGYLADVVIDDKPNLTWAQRGALNLLFWQPWNKHVNTCLYYPTITRVGTWMGVLNQIEDYDGAPVMENDLGEGAGGG
jgi:5'(3')-deoxyribonucleotidase